MVIVEWTSMLTGYAIGGLIGLVIIATIELLGRRRRHGGTSQGDHPRRKPSCR
jgi:hypothetical protein